MSETQGYKKPTEFTLPVQGYHLVRALVAERISELEAVLDDPDAVRYFDAAEFTGLSFERLMLAKMLAGMPQGGPHA